MNIKQNVNQYSTNSPMGFLEVAGPDCIDFLQGQSTCHMAELSEKPILLGAICNPKGRMIASFHAIAWDTDCIMLRLPKTMIPILIEAIQKYAAFSKVTLTDVSDQVQQVTVLSAEAIDLPSSNTRIIHPFPANPSYSECIVPVDDMTALQERLSSMTHSPVDLCSLTHICQGVIVIHPETSEQYTPAAAGFDNAGGVHFDKGCYTGQEVIARMHYLGKSKQRLVQWQCQTDHEIALTQKIMMVDDPEKAMGEVVNVCQVQDGVEGLAVCRTDVIQESGVIVEGDGGSIAVTIKQLR